MSIFESLSGVFSCMLMIFIGYYLTQRKWFDQPTAKLFSKMAMSLTIPLYMIVSMPQFQCDVGICFAEFHHQLRHNVRGGRGDKTNAQTADFPLGGLAGARHGTNECHGAGGGEKCFGCLAKSQ